MSSLHIINSNVKVSNPFKLLAESKVWMAHEVA